MRSSNALSKVLPYFWTKHSLKAKAIVIGSFLLLIFAKILAAYVPVYFQKTIDVMNGTLQSVFSVVTLIVIYGLARLSSTMLNDLREVMFSRVLYRAIRMLALDVFRHLHSLSLRFHLDRQTGAVTRYIEQGVQAMERLIQFTTYGLLPTVVEILFMWVLILFLFPYYFFLIIFATISLYIISTYIITNYRTRVLRERNQIEAHSNHRAIDSLLNYETVKYFCNEEVESNLYDRTLSKFEKTAVKLRESLALLNVIQGIIASLGLTACMYYAALGVMDNTLSLGQYVIIHSYLIQMYIPLGNLGFMYREIREALLKLSTMMEVLEAESDVKDIKEPKLISKDNFKISVEDVSFSYIKERTILNNISFNIEEGQTIALVGESGSGKSTITKLLFRFYDVTQGAIKLNGIDIRELSQLGLRGMIAVVPQDTVLFNDTLEYNIRYGKVDASDDEVQSAIKGAHLKEFIGRLPQGLQTIVGERGLKLSGGEKQRVAIARALLKSPKMLVFDEATSSLDSSTEQEIQQNLTEISKGKTALTIAHRLSTIQHADQILVLDKGSIIERGTHGELMALNGMYTKMWKQQTEKK
ncbi:MAG: ABC transporter ATP-binding protein/permease [Candidatus Paracaedibacteraceae bacterium]|nr:ABC transporter ATP-binding protein/permease [Candidatus Paracaedibacteraceae bacterium]